MMILAQIGLSLRASFHARASEWGLAVMLVNWSAILFMNETLFAEVSYVPLAEVASQRFWAWLCLCIGGSRLLVLGINGAWRRSPHARAGTAFLSCFVWFQISVGFFQAGTWSTGIAVYPVLLALDSYNVLRAMGEAGLVDDHHRRRAKKDDSN